MKTELSTNFPNPFNPSTTIKFDIAGDQPINTVLSVYNVRGQLVRSLVDGMKSTGTYQIQWDGKDDAGRTLPSGVYFYRLQAGEFNQTRKMVMMK